MRWKRKAHIQQLIGNLPSRFGDPIYCFIQRKFGELRSVNPMTYFSAGIKIAQYIHQQGQSIESKTVLEIGTGRRISLPIALWLLGASKIISVDINPYLKAKLVLDDLFYIRSHQKEIEGLFEGARSPLFTERFSQLLGVKNSLQHLCSMTNIHYLAPADATCLNLEPGSIDYHISLSVLEHIPPKTLEGILQEAKRLLKRGGLLVHGIDFADHFAHSDSSISAINFLQFSDKEWERLAGNKYMYANRLRVDDFTHLLGTTKLKILSMESNVNRKALEELKNGFPLDARFRNKTMETNATTTVWVVAGGNEIIRPSVAWRGAT